MNRKQDKIKIALLGTFPPTKGGISTNLQNLMESPLKAKYHFLKFQTMSKNQGSMRYFEEKSWMKPFRVLNELFRFVGFLQVSRPQLIHINSSFGSWSFWRDSAYLIVCKLLKKKVFMQYHGGNLDDFTAKTSKLIKKTVERIVSFPDQISVCSEVQRKPFLRVRSRNSVQVLQNMVILNPHGKDKSYRKQMSIPMDDFVILFVSAQFFKQKGIIEILDAIPKVHRYNPRAVFVMVGGGSADPTILKQIQAMGKNNQIVMTGHLDFTKLQRLFAAADCFILPSYAEGLPLALLEAMASGLPVISTPVGGIPEVIQEKVNGFLIPVGDSMALVNKIIQLMKNPVLRQKMGKNNLLKIKELFQSDVVAKQYDALYQKLINYKVQFNAQ